MSGEEKRPLMNYGDLASHYVHLSELPWKPTPSLGIDMKILLSVPEAGLLTALFRWAPGTELPLTSMWKSNRPMFSKETLSMTRERFAKATTFGTRKGISTSPARGALILSLFLKLNLFLEGELAGQELK
ncbi:hypothetical protein OKW31_003475 [Paraburkholderia atlantica]|uniref:cupin domain-containing protein n=1 Tax=Paraburkholderia atlantica TaxID=2654982 RepID=UPI003D1A932B